VKVKMLPPTASGAVTGFDVTKQGKVYKDEVAGAQGGGRNNSRQAN
jgi:hypothetical protein